MAFTPTCGTEALVPSIFLLHSAHFPGISTLREVISANNCRLYSAAFSRTASPPDDASSQLSANAAKTCSLCFGRMKLPYCRKPLAQMSVAMDKQKGYLQPQHLSNLLIGSVYAGIWCFNNLCPGAGQQDCLRVMAPDMLMLTRQSKPCRNETQCHTRVISASVCTCRQQATQLI